MADESRFAEVACVAAGLKTPEEIREEMLVDVIQKHAEEHLANVGKIYKKIYDDHRVSTANNEELEAWINEEFEI